MKNLPQTIRDVRLFSITYGDGNEFLMDLAEAVDITEADKIYILEEKTLKEINLMEVQK